MAHRESELCHALLEAYVDRDGLANLLYIRLERSLDHIAGGGTLPTTVRIVVETADKEGWLESLGMQALKDKPDCKPLKAWHEKYYMPVLVAMPTAPQWLMDSAYFDLTEVREAIREGMSDAVCQVVGFGVCPQESAYVRKLSHWLQRHLIGQTEAKDPLNLNPTTGNVARRLQQVRRYRHDLDEVNVLCEVVVDGAATQESVAEFWTAACAELGGAGRNLVLMFSSNDSTKFPEGVKVLPQPRFRSADVAHWAETVVAGRPDWPLGIAISWTKWLCSEAALGDELNIGVLYEVMDYSIKIFLFQNDADKFLAELENGTLR